MKKRMSRKTIIVWGAVAGLLAITYLLTKPFIGRLQGNMDRSQVYNAYSLLVESTDEFIKANPNKQLQISDVQAVIQDDDKLKNLKHPHNKQPYKVKILDNSGFIDGPEGRQFLNYAGLDGTSFYFGYGSCEKPNQTAKGEYFLVYNMKMKRVGESSGVCAPLPRDS